MSENKIPIYELYYYGLENPTFIDILTYWLHRHNWRGMFNWLIYHLDMMSLGKCLNMSHKLIKSVSADVTIKGGDGEDNNTITIFRTKPFEVWTMELEDGKVLKSADEHIIFADQSKRQDWYFVDELVVGDFVYTEDGWKKIVSIKNTHAPQFMFDMSLERF